VAESIFDKQPPEVWLASLRAIVRPSAVKEFFKELTAHLKIESFTPREFFGSPDFVTVIGHTSGRCRAPRCPPSAIDITLETYSSSSPTDGQQVISVWKAVNTAYCGWPFFLPPFTSSLWLVPFFLGSVWVWIVPVCFFADGD